ncbi:MAG TPA: hypothetical protein VGL19_20080 [Polyangiaceae bacterium]
MKPRRTSSFARRLAAFAALCLAAVLAILLPNGERNAKASDRIVLAVVVAKTSNVQDISMSELKRVFMNEGDSDSGGQRYVPFNHPPHTTDRVAFDRLVLGMSPDEVSQFWIDRKIRGLSGPPRSVDSLSLLLRLIGRLPGAISYARPAQLTGEVRAVRVNGKLPSDPEYPLSFNE